MKKVISGLLATLLIIAASIPSFAGSEVFSSSATTVAVPVTVGTVAADPKESDPSNAAISEEKARQIAAEFFKDCFGVQVDDTSYQSTVQYTANSYYSYSPFGTSKKKYVWNISYQKNGSNYSYTYAQISVDASSGKIIQMNRYNGVDPTQQSIAVYTREESQKICEDFLKKYNPDVMNRIKYVDQSNMYQYGSYKSANYEFYYTRLENGIPFNEDSITVMVDGVTGTVSNFYMNWDDSRVFPSADPAINKAEAQALLDKQLKLSLSYIIKRKDYNSQPESAILAYSIGPDSAMAVDAGNASLITPTQMISQTSGEAQKSKDLTDAERAALYAKHKELQKPDKELDSSGAQSIMEGILKNMVGDAYKIDNISYSDSRGSWMGYKTWSAQVYEKDSIPNYGPSSGYISIDAATGQLLSFNSYNNFGEMSTQEFTPAITWEDSYAKALDVIAQLYPDKIKDINTNQKYTKMVNSINGVEIPERYYGFNFMRVVNGIPCSDNMISVSIDIKTGLVSNLYKNWYDDISFEAVGDEISPDSAKEIYLDKYKTELAYMSVPDPDGKEPGYQIKLLYSLNANNRFVSYYYINATDGKWVDFLGNGLEEKAVSNFKEKIKGHWAEKELQLMADQGIIDTSNFEPDREITKLEAVKMLVNAKGYNYYRSSDTKLKFTNVTSGSEEYRYLEEAVNYGIIDNAEGAFVSDAKVSREEMAEMIVKLVKYDKLAGARDIFSLKYTDAGEISRDKYGYVAIGTGFGMFDGYNGQFRPKANTTMAEMASAIYKGIDAIQQK
jgi:hypothetical protein